MQGHHNYAKFVKALLRKLTSEMKPDEINQLGQFISVVHNERLAAEKAKDNPKGKPKGKKGELNLWKPVSALPLLIRFVAPQKKTQRADLEEDFVEDELDAFM